MEDDVTTKRIIHGVFGGIIVLCISVIALFDIWEAGKLSDLFASQSNQPAWQYW